MSLPPALLVFLEILHLDMILTFCAQLFQFTAKANIPRDQQNS